MDAVDWSGIGVLAALLVGSLGYRSRQVARLEDRMRARFDRVDARIDRLEERCVRHLELHASPHA